jgi:two-component sensor histidine kinase
MTSEIKARESFIRELYETTSNQTKNFDEKISHLLKMGCEKLGLENGLLLKTEKEYFEILYIHSNTDIIKPKERIPFQSTAKNSPLILNPDEENNTKTYQVIQKKFKFESYFGTLISINGQSYGSLDFFSSLQRKTIFSSTEKTMIKLIAQWIENEIERIQVEEKIRNSLKEKEILLKEIHHRVKNNLQVVSSLLNLQSYYIKDETAIKIFRESQYRIKSMALIHQNLYQSQHLAKIDFYDYVEKLVSYLIHSYSNNPEMIKIKLDITPESLGLDSAIPCGLIINELVSNSLKYAFPENKEGEIFIGLIYNNNFELTISDNGIGFPNEIDIKNTESLGLQLVHTLTEQLDGELEFESKPGKTEFKIKFFESKILSKQS